MSGRYAKKTTVSPEKSQADIRKALMRYGVSGMMIGDDFENNVCYVVFMLGQINIKITAPLPSPDEERFQITDTGRERSEKSKQDAYEQEVRSCWRRLLLAIQAKLESVEAGISTVEQEFLAFMVTEGGATVGELMLPEIHRQIDSGQKLNIKALPCLGGG